MKAKFLRHEGFLGAVGAFLKVHPMTPPKEATTSAREPRKARPAAAARRCLAPHGVGPEYRPKRRSPARASRARRAPPTGLGYITRRPCRQSAWPSLPPRAVALRRGAAGWGRSACGAGRAALPGRGQPGRRSLALAHRPLSLCSRFKSTVASGPVR